jgi:hypothetical protein
MPDTTMPQFDLKKFLAEQRNYQKARLLKEEAGWGFGKIVFSPRGFEEVLKALRIPPQPRVVRPMIKSLTSIRMLMWSGPGIEIFTDVNPMDGTNSVSYMGIYGAEAPVFRAIKLVHQYATYIKSSSPGLPPPVTWGWAPVSSKRK